MQFCSLSPCGVSALVLAQCPLCPLTSALCICCSNILRFPLLGSTLDPQTVKTITVTPYLPLSSSWEFVAWSDMETTGPWMARGRGWCGVRCPFREGDQLLVSSAGGWRGKGLRSRVFL